MLASTCRSAGVLQRVLTKVRYLAQTGWEPERLALVLDYAENLAAQIATEVDSTTEFEEQLRGLGERFPEFAGIWTDYEQGRI